jgi:hypothetical protein
MTTLTVKPRNKKELSILKKVLKALDADFETSISDDSSYSPEFVTKILKSREDSENGKGRKTTLEELNALWK